MKQNSAIKTNKEKKQQRFLMLLPLIILPFLTFFFWSLGRVGGNEAKASVTNGGLNMQLPDAKLNDNKTWNKLSFYEQADKDSAKYREAVKNDPSFEKDSTLVYPAQTNSSSLSYNPMPPANEDPNEYKVNQKLAQLNAALGKNNKEDMSYSHEDNEKETPSIKSYDVNRLEHMLQAVNQPDSETDPETKELNGMMDKILDIQHPERVADEIQQTSEKNKKLVFPVTSKQNDSYSSLLQSSNKIRKGETKKESSVVTENAFYSLKMDTGSEQSQNIIEAEVEETQTIVSGATVRLCLINDVYVNGILIRKGTFVYGIASQAADRLNMAIQSIRYANNLFPVSLSVYDLDGLEGIYIPGSINRDVAKQSGSEAINNMGFSSLSPSLGVQAANAGVAAAKTLINKKIKQVKVTIKAGYKVLLKDDNQK